MSDSEDETKSETSDISDYPDVDIEEDYVDNQEVYTEFLIEKYRLIISFIEGIIQPNIYEISLAGINRELREAMYNERNVEQDILNKEAQLNTTLSEFESKIKNYIEEKWIPRKEYTFRSELVKELFTEIEIENLKILRYQLDELLESSKPSDDQDSYFKLKNLNSEWKSLSPEQKVNLEKLTHLNYPIKSNFTNTESFQKAKEDFLMDISIFLNSYWDEYEENEEIELLRVAKKLGFKAPPKKDKKEYESFLKKMLKYLEYGYIYKINTTKLGGIYEKINTPSMQTKLKELTKIQRELPIRLKKDEQLFSDKFNLYKQLLQNIDKKHLIQCILSAPRFKNTLKDYLISPREIIGEVVKERTNFTKKEDDLYKIETIQELNALLLAQKTLLEQLQREQKSMERVALFPETISDKKIKELNLPSNITPGDKIKWNKLIEHTLKPKLNLIIRQGYVNKLRKMYKQYNLDTNPNDKQQQIKKITEDIRNIIQAISSKYKDNLIESNFVDYQSPQFVSVIYPYIDKIRIGQLIYSVRRKLLPSSLNYLIELYDINELTNKSRVIYASKKQKIISSSIFIKIKQHLLNRIRSIEPEYKLLFKNTLKDAIGLISQETGIILPRTTNIRVIIKTFNQKWKKSWNGEMIKDVYGKNVFETFLSSPTPFEFYSSHSNKIYNELVKQFTPIKQPVYTRAQAMHDGVWYNVQFLGKNPLSGQPSLIYKSELELNPKTKKYEVVNKVSVRNGTTPYIKILLRTEQEGELKETWKEVRPGEIKKRQT